MTRAGMTSTLQPPNAQKKRERERERERGSREREEGRESGKRKSGKEKQSTDFDVKISRLRIAKHIYKYPRENPIDTCSCTNYLL